AMKKNEAKKYTKVTDQDEIIKSIDEEEIKQNRRIRRIYATGNSDIAQNYFDVTDLAKLEVNKSQEEADGKWKDIVEMLAQDTQALNKIKKLKNCPTAYACEYGGMQSVAAT